MRRSTRLWRWQGLVRGWLDGRSPLHPNPPLGDCPVDKRLPLVSLRDARRSLRSRCRTSRRLDMQCRGGSSRVRFPRPHATSALEDVGLDAGGRVRGLRPRSEDLVTGPVVHLPHSHLGPWVVDDRPADVAETVKAECHRFVAFADLHHDLPVPRRGATLHRPRRRLNVLVGDRLLGRRQSCHRGEDWGRPIRPGQQPCELDNGARVHLGPGLVLQRLGDR